MFNPLISSQIFPTLGVCLSDYSSRLSALSCLFSTMILISPSFDLSLYPLLPHILSK